MVNDILDISKIESGNLSLDKTKTEVKSFINSLLPEIEEIVNEKVIEYELFVEENLPEIYFDRNRIKQVIFHLISNATKNTEFGKITLTVKYKLNTHNKPEILFSVIDTGKGIEISDQKDLFKPFILLSHHEKNRSAGSGLGLALSKAIIELHSGRIGIKSSIPGKGSEFFFTLPIK
jgi:signal transduction histidine kinase